MENFSDYTKLVIARMGSNPEEFMPHSPKHRWDTLVMALQDIARDPDIVRAKALWALPKEEVSAMLETYRAIYLADMYKNMLQQILGGADSGTTDTRKGTVPQYEYDPQMARNAYASKQGWENALRQQNSLQQSSIGQAFNDASNYGRL
jgi:hypothetical protein